MIARIRAWISLLRRSDRGVSALEFAMTAPVMLIMIMGTVELGHIALVRSTLENTVSDAARLGITGNSLPTMSRDAMVLTKIRDGMAYFSTDAELNICRRSYASVADINKPEPYTDSNNNGRYDAGESFGDTNGNGVWDTDMGTAGLGGPGDIVVYDVSYAMPFLFDYFIGLLAAGDKVTLTASAVVRNEPWAQQAPMTSAAPKCVA